NPATEPAAPSNNVPANAKLSDRLHAYKAPKTKNALMPKDICDVFHQTIKELNSDEIVGEILKGNLVFLEECKSREPEELTDLDVYTYCTIEKLEEFPGLCKSSLLPYRGYHLIQGKSLDNVRELSTDDLIQA